MSQIDDITEMEMQAIQAIYMEDMSVSSGDGVTRVDVSVLPSTADNKSDQFVRLSLRIHIPNGYPNTLPSFEFFNIRGLKDSTVNEIKCKIESLSQQKIGEIMIYDLIEMCKDLLTSYNFPDGNMCAICRYDFTTFDEIVKNDCYHHLHYRCLAEYILSIRKSNLKDEDSNDRFAEVIKCPVCRDNIDISNFSENIDINKYSLPHLSKQPINDELAMIEEAKQNVYKFNSIYMKQCQNGGIIDKEAEKNKFFIRISNLNNAFTDDNSQNN